MRCGLFTFALVFLASCVPVQDAVSGAVNETTGDSAALGPSVQSLLFAPAGTVTGVVVDVLGDNLKSHDPKDNCTGGAQHLVCELGSVSELTVIELTGVGVSAVVSYRRAGQIRLELLSVAP